MLKRFMTWLLHQFQKVMGLFNRKSPDARSAAPTARTADTNYSSQPTTDIDDPVALRTSLPHSTASPRPNSSPTPNDAVNPDESLVTESAVGDSIATEPVAAEPDTHQRLDAASAARPGGVVAVPSFPTEVSELLSSQSSLQPPSPQIDVDKLKETALPVSEQGPSEQQLPDIHDLLPAVEPKVEENDVAAPVEDAFDEPVAAASPATVPAEAPLAVSEDAVEIETAERVSSTDQAMLFSFDISEADTQLEEALEDSMASEPEVLSESSLDTSESLESEPVESEPVEPEPSEPEPSEPEPLEPRPESVDDEVSETVLDAEPVAESLAIADESAAAVAEDNATSFESSSEAAQPLDASGLLSETAELEETAENRESTDVVSEEIGSEEIGSEEVGSEEVFESAVLADATPETPAVINPWLTAKPPASTTELSEAEDAETEALKTENAETEDTETENAEKKTVDTETFPTKTGVVKLLFVLKPGNFHGYIAPDDGTKDILFHQKYINADIFDRLERGTKVVATIKHIENKVYATRVDLVS
ncbi:MAG: cold shock domain-containing protein [Cyanobacteria bacterium J06607_10]